MPGHADGVGQDLPYEHSQAAWPSWQRSRAHPAPTEIAQQPGKAQRAGEGCFPC